MDTDEHRQTQMRSNIRVRRLCLSVSRLTLLLVHAPLCGLRNCRWLSSGVYVLLPNHSTQNVAKKRGQSAFALFIITGRCQNRHIPTKRRAAHSARPR